MTSSAALLKALCRLGMHGHAPRSDRCFWPAFSHRPFNPQLPGDRRWRPLASCHRLPEALPNVAADPSFQLEDRSAVFGQPIVSPPASHVGAPVVPQFCAGQTLAASPHLSYFLFESLQTLRRYFDFRFRGSVENPGTCVPRPAPFRSCAAFTSVADVRLDPLAVSHSSTRSAAV